MSSLEVKYCFAVILISFLGGAVSHGSDWWKTMQLYQIYPRSFKDSDGDGIGDLRGIIEKLDHVKDTGAAAIWLSPIFESPMFDFGYDTSDYTKIAVEYGTMKDFEDLVSTANKSDLKIILDFVPNHTSHLHEWFVLSADRVPGFEDFYIWHPGKTDPEDNAKRLPPSNWLSVFRGSAWTWHEGRGEFYYHQFLPQQPDLNYRNPLVVEAMKDVMRFWLDRGAAGFRIDAIPHLFEADPMKFEGQFPDEKISELTDDVDSYGYLTHTYTRDMDELYDVVYDWRKLLDEYDGDARIMMMEAMSDIKYVMRYYGNETMEGAHFPFNFALTFLTSTSSVENMKASIDYWLTNVPDGRVSNWVVGNHDQSRVASRFGSSLSQGILMIELLLPGVAVTYYGEEIGMIDQFLTYEDTMDPQACNQGREDYWGNSRDPQRTPFQWDSSPNAGFSSASKTWLPIADNYVENNLNDQQNSKRSYYQFYKKLSALRSEKTIKEGDIKTVAFGDAVFACSRTLSNETTFIVLVNMKNKVVNINLNEEFVDLKTKVMFTKVVNWASLQTIGFAIIPDNIELQGYESIILSSTYFD